MQSYAAYKFPLFFLLCLASFTCISASSEPNTNSTLERTYTQLEVHLGLENEVSLSRVNYPLYILLEGVDWRTYNEQFRQLGLLVDMWDQARRGEIMLDETRNVPLQGGDRSVFSRQIRIVRTDWKELGEKCGYRSKGVPNSGCAYNKRLPRCTIYVPHQPIYSNGDINEFHNLLGHEMWHCLAGSFH